MNKILIFILLFTGCNGNYDQANNDFVRMSCIQKASKLKFNYIVQQSECDNKDCLYKWIDNWIENCIKETLK